MIGKTRHGSTRAQFGQGCGILRHSAPPGFYAHRRFAAPDELAAWIEHFWLEEWRFDTAAPQTRDVLPHPSVQLVFAPQRSRIYGVQLGRFVRQLRGNERIFGIKFRPGAFYPLLRRPVSSLANTSIALQDVFPDTAEVEREILSASDDAQRVQRATRFLRGALPAPDPRAAHAGQIVQRIASDSRITRVEQVLAGASMHERTLQRRFDRYVGASPRWVIKRYRIYEALERVGSGSAGDWAALAQDLGYFDQAHFANEFRRMTGRSPGEYVRPPPREGA